MELADLVEFIEGTTLCIDLPYGIGFGLAGDWSVVAQGIVECLPQVVLYKLVG
jgi:hypothetical protein